jgi:hypothetical protein
MYLCLSTQIPFGNNIYHWELFLNELNLVNVFTAWNSEIDFDICVPCTFRSLRCSIDAFRQKDLCICICTVYGACLSQYAWGNIRGRIRWNTNTMKLIMLICPLVGTEFHSHPWNSWTDATSPSCIRFVLCTQESHKSVFVWKCGELTSVSGTLIWGGGGVNSVK